MGIAALAARPLSLGEGDAIRYSFCTLVTDLDEYSAMVDAFTHKGFASPDCEYLYADNTQGNVFDAFTAYNRFPFGGSRSIHRALPPGHPAADRRPRRPRTATRCTDRARPALGPCAATAGRRTTAGTSIASRTATASSFTAAARFPVKVMSLDENLMIVRREANLALSRGPGRIPLVRRRSFASWPICSAGPPT